MTNEEMQRTMQFILEQRALFAAGMQQLKEMQAQTELNFSALKAKLIQGKRVRTRLNRARRKLAKAQKRTEEKLAALAETQRRTEEKMGKTDERLKNLHIMVERYISERRNGKSEDRGS